MIVVADTNEVGVSNKVADTVLDSVSEAASADGDDVTDNVISSLAEATLTDAESDDEGELVMETDPLSKLVTEAEGVAEVENPLLCDSKELEESETEDDNDCSCDTELLRDGTIIVFEAFIDVEPVIVPPPPILLVGERNELRVCDRDMRAVFVKISAIETIGELDTLALDES